MRLPSTFCYLKRVHVRSQGRGRSGYFLGCAAYLDDGHLTVLLRHCRNTRLRRPFPVVALDPPTIELGDPENFDGFVPLSETAGHLTAADATYEGFG